MRAANTGAALATLAVLIVTALPAWARPVTIVVGPPQKPAVTYGPADMLCDLNTCRLFNLPPSSGLPSNAIVEFGMPSLGGQDRVDMRRCLQICRASVVGVVESQKAAPGDGNPTIAIDPIEMRLD